MKSGKDEKLMWIGGVWSFCITFGWKDGPTKEQKTTISDFPRLNNEKTTEQQNEKTTNAICQLGHC